MAGTNGKGSTSAYIECLLRYHGSQSDYPLKTGLYTSPHLQHIRERIRINGESISEERFTVYFFEVWTKLPKVSSESLDIPRYLQLLLLVAIHACFQEGVDVFICEAHMGGEFDATNVFESPVLSVLTTISEDHIKLLGPSVADIAAHKAGIMKRGRPALSTTQSRLVQPVLENVAIERNARLRYITGLHPTIEEAANSLASPLKENFTLATAVVSLFLEETEITTGRVLCTETIRLVLGSFHPAGRFQRLIDANKHWYIDGAHNKQGIEAAATWFLRGVQQEPW